MKTSSIIWFAIAVAAVGFVAVASQPDTPTLVEPAPVVKPAPTPAPCPPKKPRWEDTATPFSLNGDGWRGNGVTPRVAPKWDASISGPVFPDGTEIHCDYPGDRHRKNTVSKGSGLCVFTSIHHACDWADVDALKEMPKYLIDKGIPGGGYPTKVQQVITRMCKEKGVPEPEYFQIEASPAEAFPILEAATASGRMVCITYYRSPTGRYNGQHISHMVNLPHLDKRNAAILDNNYPGSDKYEVMTPDELAKAACGSDGRLWAVIFNAPGPPPTPRTAKVVMTNRSLAWKVGKTCPCSRECVCGCNDGDACKCGDVKVENFGVEESKLSAAPKYRHGEYEITQQEMMYAASKLPDDGKKLRIVAVGSKESTDKLAIDWKGNPALAPFHDTHILQCYPPDHWVIKGNGYVETASPAIHLLRPDGVSLGWVDGYVGPDNLATALRRKAPDYDPSKDKITPGVPLNSPAPFVPFAVVGAVGVVAFALTRKS